MGEAKLCSEVIFRTSASRSCRSDGLLSMRDRSPWNARNDRMKTTTASGLALVSCFALLACGGDKPLPKEPEAPAIELPKSDFTPVTSSSTAEPTAVDAVPEPTAGSAAIKEIIGTVTKVEVQEHGKKKHDIAKAADVDAFLEAVGTDQSPSGDRRRCADDFVAVLKDKDGTEKGSIGVCRGDSLGAELWAPGVERRGFTVADEAAFKKALKMTDKPAGEKKKPAGEKKSGPKK